MADTEKTFQCTVIAPQGRLLDCRATGVIIPAHDGQLGILPGHMPIFCELGIGPMAVKCASAREGQPPVELCIFLDGGFAMFNSNNLAVTASSGLNLHDCTTEKFEQLIEKCKAAIAAPATTAQHKATEERRLNLLESLRSRVGVQPDSSRA